MMTASGKYNKMTNGNEKTSTVNSAGMSYLPEKNFPV